VPGRPERVDVLGDPAAAAARGALLVTRALRRAVHARGRATLFLAGGASPLALYRGLTAEPLRGRVPWARVEVFWGDERCVPPEAPESNFRAAREALLDGLPAAPRAVHRIPAELGAALGARRTAAMLRAALGERGRPDLVLLGLGADGHSASLFPGQDWVGNGWTVAARSPRSPQERISLALPLLARARTLLLFVTGADKAAAVARVAAGDDLPAARLRPGRYVWVLDAAAAATIAPRCSRADPSAPPSPAPDSADPSPRTSGSSSASS
jgi:6-phosphogluconolactonase